MAEELDVLLLNSTFNFEIDNIEYQGLAYWDGNAFHGVFPGDRWNSVGSICEYNDEIHFRANISFSERDTIYSWDGSSVSPVLGLHKHTGHMLEFDDELNTTRATDGEFPSIYHWDGLSLDSSNFNNYQPDFGSFNFFYPQSLKTYQNLLYIGGNIASTYHPGYKEIVSWDGESYGSLGDGVPGFAALVMDLEVFNNELYVAGLFWQAEGNPSNCIMRWDGEEFLPVGDIGANSRVDKILAHEGYLYASGSFSEMDGIPCRIAQWDGASWACFNNDNFGFTGPDDNAPIERMAVFRDTLYVSRGFHSINGEYFNRLAKYNGSMPTNPLSVEEGVDPLEQINIYPNPTSSQLNLSLGGNSQTDIELRIFNPIGGLVYDEVLGAFSQEHSINLDLNSGLYFLELRMGDAIRTEVISLLR